jgi:aryl-alcohol dehydrogenase-like predicted oxidoreductase
VRYRRFGRSDLEVSEVGFGVWTLASDWWGRIDDPRGMLHAAIDAGINFIDTAPVYGDNGVGETLLADLLKSNRSEIVLTTKCGYDIDSPRPESQSERRQDWEPASVRAQLEASLRRLGTDYIDLYQLHNARLDPIHDDALWEELAKFRFEGKVRELGVALGPAIGWVEEGLTSIRERDIVSLQTVFNILEQEPGLSFAAEPNVVDGRVGLISRVPHASDTLSGVCIGIMCTTVPSSCAPVSSESASMQAGSSSEVESARSLSQRDCVMWIPLAWDNCSAGANGIRVIVVSHY